MSQTAELLADKVLRQCNLEPTTISELNKQYEQATQQAPLGNAGWHGADDIQTLVGLEGTFLWTENIFAPSQIQFTFDAGHVGETGTYKITSLQSLPIEHGTFFSVPNNPAIGWAFINLIPQAGSPRPFIVSGMFTDQAWKISILLLNKIGATGPVQPPFSAVRIS